MRTPFVVNTQLAPEIEGISHLVPGAPGDAVWIGRFSDGTLARVMVVDDPRLPADLGTRLQRRAGVLMEAGSHRGAVRVLAITQTSTGHLAVVTEHHPLGTLDRVLDASRAEWGEVALIGAQIADALAAAHRNRVLHGRISPAAVHLGSDRRTRLGGFGEIGEMEHRLELTTSTLPYVAPERAATSAADVYSLAATLLRAGTGHDPTPDADLSQVPKHLRFVLALALAAEPTHRPSAADMAEMLRAIVQGEDPAVVLRRRHVEAEPIDLVDEEAVEPEVQVRLRRPGRMVKLAAFLALAIGAVIAGGALAKFTGDTSGEQSPATSVADPSAGPADAAVTDPAVGVVAPVTAAAIEPDMSTADAAPVPDAVAIDPLTGEPVVAEPVSVEPAPADPAVIPSVVAEPGAEVTEPRHIPPVILDPSLLDLLPETSEP